ncbi:molybdenum cofactor guanylyltransferase MobA [Litorivicinus lipolyticus]|jgi:molybdenum cofactor guanylyltransferase|uniref:Molybdenum cofactor guanylyltransferase n=1 Tax=Litorivicinus lipolyticus TaxID=418701 RepID=A0A5Q2QB23_9GAMM|nr:molybdenum cofactor guanylyltransferase MobA [Litorivicinus lipolyticus]QGG79266.1 molybdenum cofactor guanylyltransferase MobA [Litorivicinus lipolyticus]
MNEVGVILAGGQARRMGGGDKGRLRLGSTSLIEQVIARAEPQLDRLILNANGDLGRFDDLGLVCVADSIGDYPGPLAGVLAAMDWAAEHQVEWVVSVAADTPFFPLDLVERLRATGAPVTLAATPDPQRGRLPQPTFGRWRVDLRDDLRAALNDGVRKIRQWTQRHGEALVVFETDPMDPFFNINTQADLARASELLACK